MLLLHKENSLIKNKQKKTINILFKGYSYISTSIIFRYVFKDLHVKKRFKNI